MGDPYANAGTLSASIDRFLIAARLIHASTTQSCWQACGIETRVSKMNPMYTTYDKPILSGAMVRRTTRLAAEDDEPFARLITMLEATEVDRNGIAATSFDIALNRFLRTYRSANAFDDIVDLATALEAVLTGSDADTEAIGLRFRSRAAALLVTDQDPARVIFEDLGHFYRLRSTLVHGGNLKQQRLRTDIMSVSTVSKQAPLAMAAGFAVDRLRDLVRRAILARLCLAAGPDPVWRFDSDVPVDALLVDEITRVSWRSRWREQVAALGCPSAADPARPGVDWISLEDR